MNTSNGRIEKTVQEFKIYSQYNQTLGA